MTEEKTKKTTEKPLDRKGKLLWIGLFSFVSLWMFALGVLVGRGTAPVRFDIEKLQKELASLKAADLQQQIKRFKINSPDRFDKPDLGFHEALKSAAPENPDRKPVKPPPPKKLPPSEKRAPAPGSGSEELNRKAMVESDRQYTIQVAASQEQGVADQMVARLKAKGYPAYRETSRIPGKGVWHRVRIGAYRDRTEADRFLETLHQDKLKGFVLKR